MKQLIERCRKGITFLLCGVQCLAPAIAQVPYPPGINPSSAHSVDWCASSDGMGGGTTYNRGSGPGGLDVAGVLTVGCSEYAAAHTNGSKTNVFISCVPRLPDSSRLTSFGGEDADYLVDGTIAETAYGKTTFFSGAWSLATCGCTDSRKTHRVQLGNDGSCYCPAGWDWNDGRRTCVQSGTKNLLDKKAACPERVGNPVYPLKGIKAEIVTTGVSLAGLEWVLNYDSTHQLPPDPASVGIPTLSAGAVGYFWNSNYHRSLQIATNLKSAVLSRGDGSILNFSGNGSGTFTADLDSPHQLLSVPGGYLFVDRQTAAQEKYDASGNLLEIHTGQGRVLTFSYAAGNLIRVTADDGRAVRFAYMGGRLSRVYEPSGAVLRLGYDAQVNLATLTWQDGRVRSFSYEMASLPHALTGITDEAGQRYATFSYDALGFAIGTAHAGGADNYSLSYTTPPAMLTVESYDPSTGFVTRTLSLRVPDGISVVSPNGQSAALAATQVAGVPLLASKSQPAGSGCGASSQAVAYDAAGNVLSRDDFDGTRACYAYDSLRRQTARIEGLTPTTVCATALAASVVATGARKVQTSWHPDGWHLPVQVQEPRKRETRVYQGQPDPSSGGALASCTPAPSMPNGKAVPVLCKRIEQALLDNGAPDPASPATVWSFSYDSVGRIISSTDPNQKTTSYAYYQDNTFPASSDPDLDKVVLLLHPDGQEGAPTVVDESASANPVTLAGTTHVGASPAGAAGSSLVFSGPGDYATIPYNTDLTLGAGDFTIEAFVYKTGNSASNSRIWHANGESYAGVSLNIDAAGNFGVYASVGGYGWDYSLPVVAPLANGRWYHLTVVRQGGSLYAFVDGTRYTVTTALGTKSVYASPSRAIGGQKGIARPLLGAIRELRVTKGKARYTDNFQPPTQRFAQTWGSPDDVGHLPGDLQSITNPSGQTTVFSAYDRAGRARAMVDAKGIRTDIALSPRGWVTALNVTPPGGTARTTTYTYDAVGQLTGVSNPDGTTLAYAYDAAHRLAGIKDARGNAVTFTLDAGGNRVGEQYSDPTGALQRTISRSFDALNRIQQATGATQ